MRISGCTNTEHLPMTSTSLIGSMRNGTGFCRSVASLVAAAVLWLSVYPSLLVAQELSRSEDVFEDTGASNESALNELLIELQFALDDIAINKDDQETVEQLWESIAGMEEDIRELDAEIVSDLDELRDWIVEKDLPEVILDRHIAAVSGYKQELYSLFTDIEDVRGEADSKNRTELAIALAERLGTIKKKRSDKKIDTNNLPTRSTRPNPENIPKTAAVDFAIADPMGDGRNLVANIEPTVPPGDDAFFNPDWLAESDEVEITQAIVDKAAELNNSPVEIYHWVRNTIRWSPNWGAKQTAQLTLELRSGNSMDISSLTIALMRAAGIPARYVHGTIDVPEDEFRNWAGGFVEPNSAMVFAASGGIPINALASGGRVTKARMEHVWVEVAVDYVPTRAARNLSPDSWIAIDPSFKQYAYTESLEQLPITGVDTDAVGQDYINSGTVNPDGSVSGFDTTILEAAEDQSTAAIETYISNNIPNPTIGDAFGERVTIVQEFPVLASALPYKVIVEGARFASIPQSLQQSIQFGLGTNVFGQVATPVRLPWAAVNNKKITLSFTPATPEDLAVLEALAPSTEVIDFSQLPTSIPAYLIEVIPELRIEGEVIAAGDPMPLGEEMEFHFNPTIAGVGALSYSYSVISGSYLSVAAIGNDVATDEFNRVHARLQQTATDIHNLPPLSLDVQREELMGDLFHAGLLGYYSNYVAYAEILAAGNRDQHHLSAGLGSIGYEPKLVSLFGIPRALDTGSVFGDLPLVRVIGINEGGNGERKFASVRDFNLALGIIGSVLEHAVPEVLFKELAEPGSEAMSAVKALDIASNQGQRIFRINQSNIASTIDQVNQSPAILSDIESAVATGMEVIIHSDPVNASGFGGAGYIIFDPVTGDGAYLISGGSNGFFIVLLIAFMVIISMLALKALAAGALISWPLFFLIFETSTFLFWVDQIKKAETDADLGEAHVKAMSIMVLPFIWEAAIASGASAEVLAVLGFGAVFGKMISKLFG